jgi:hypothetical protein
VAASFAAPEGAAVQAPTPEPAPKVTGTVGVDFPTTYFFRGVRQDPDPEFTMQPFVNVAIAASETTTVNVGSWNSIHTSLDTKGGFYESDFYVSAVFSAGKVTPTVLYTAYMSPADLFGPVHEIALILGFDAPMAPSITVAQELGYKSADGGASKGSYFEVALNPAIPMGDDSPISVTIPVKLGMSLKDYYENPFTLEDSKFGYFSVGAAIGGKVSDSVELHGGVTVYAFGDTLKLSNNDKSAQVVGSFGLSFGF